MPKIAIIDSLYPDFVATLPDPVNGSYETELAKVLAKGFGTFDAFSFYLKQVGWNAIDILSNHDRLQQRWAMEAKGWGSASRKAIVLQQISDFDPQVVFLQDLSLFNASELELLSKKYLLAAQCSCAIHPGKYSDISVIFTSLPRHVERFRALGVPTVEYLPLAFDPRMLTEESPKKQFDISFVGGVGRNSHWRAGTDVLEAVAKAFPGQCHFYIYGRENLAKDSPLLVVSGPPVWGREMYSVYGRSKIVVNRHGEVAEGFTNNLRCFEAMGMGAMLLTEASPNLSDLLSPAAIPYVDAGDLVEEIAAWLRDIDDLRVTAKYGQDQILQNHTYAHRMKVVSEVLTHALEKVAA